MTSTEIVVLQSSPPHQQRDEEPITTPPAFQYVPNSSSSDGSSLPSVSKLWTKWDSRQKGEGVSKVSPLPLDSRLKGRSHPSALPTDGSSDFQSVNAMVEQKKISIEEEMVGVQDGKLKGGKSTPVKKNGGAAKSKQSRAPAKTRLKTKRNAAELDQGIEKEVKTKAKRKSRAKVTMVNIEGSVSNHFDQSIQGQSIGVEKLHDLAKEVKPKTKRKSRAKPVVSTHFDQNDATGEHGGPENEKTAALPTKKRKRKDVDDEEDISKSIKHAPKPRNKTGKASTHFTIGNIPELSKNETNSKAVSTIAETHEPMDMADKRRKSWTPVLDTVPTQPKLSGHDIYEVPSSSQPPTPDGAKLDFRSMIGSFGLDSKSVTRSASPEKDDFVGLNKRRRTEVCYISCIWTATIKHTDNFSSSMIPIWSP